MVKYKVECTKCAIKKTVDTKQKRAFAVAHDYPKGMFVKVIRVKKPVKSVKGK